LKKLKMNNKAFQITCYNMSWLPTWKKYKILFYLAVTVLAQTTHTEICTEDPENGVYGSCEGYESNWALISFGGSSNLGFFKNLGYGDIKNTVPQIFPCKVHKHGEKLVTLGLELPKTTFNAYDHQVKVYLRSGPDCYVHSGVNPDEKPACILDMIGHGSTCLNLTSVWVSDGKTQGAQASVCALLYCEVSEES